MGNVNTSKCYQFGHDESEPHDAYKAFIAPKTSHVLANLKSEITFADAADMNPTTPIEMWKIVERSSSTETIELRPTTSRKGWKTIRIFVSSTFRDFHQEREVLVKDVFPDLRLWCEGRKLRLIECDLRWGVPKDTEAEETIRICLGELDRCYEENTAPFFLNLSGDRAGWIPTVDDLSEHLAAQYDWVRGLSITEMEIVHGAIRKQNPNALFMMRNANGIEEIPYQIKSDIFQDDSYLKEKLAYLKSVIHQKVPEKQVQPYVVRCRYNEMTNSVDFDGLRDADSLFSSTVFEFFKRRIDELYPLDLTPSDPLEMQKREHEAFLLSRSSCVIGRDSIIRQVHDYIDNDSDTNGPLVISGVAGSGKSSVIAKCAYNATMKLPTVKRKNRLWQWRDQQMKIFYHFVGATPRSTDLSSFLQRLTKELKPDLRETQTNLESLVTLTYGLLQSRKTKPTIVFVDGLNQIDDAQHQFLSRWLPDKLSQNVRVIVSTIEGTSTHRALQNFKSSPKDITCGALDADSRRDVVTNMLRTFNKKLGEDQMELLLSKKGSENPLWLSLACEELRIFGVFQEVTEKIGKLPDDLIDLEISILQRYEEESGGNLVKSCLCLLEVSRYGLLETELLMLLSGKDKFKEQAYTTQSPETTTLQEDSGLSTTNEIGDTNENVVKDAETRTQDQAGIRDTDGKRSMDKAILPLPAREWAVLYRNVKPLLRPCGDLGDGRLDFYHRSLSKAVRQKYFSGESDDKQQKYNFWHGILADYFSSVRDMDRKAEELPYHLEKMMDSKRLVQCLTEWGIFERMYNEDFSADLLHWWQQCGGYDIAAGSYTHQLAALRKRNDVPLIQYAEVLEKVYGFLIQAGMYPNALQLIEERLADEVHRLGERAEKLSDVYYPMAHCKHYILRSAKHLSQCTTDGIIQVIDYCEKSINYRQRLKGDENMYRRGLSYIMISFNRNELARKYESSGQDHAAEILKAFKAIEKAERIFRQLKDLGHMAECRMSKGLIDRFNRPLRETEPLLLRALDICLQAYGERHTLLERIYPNIFILYGQHRNHEAAFEYLLKTRDTRLSLYGRTLLQHVETLREE